jgi:hypothetical protein
MHIHSELESAQLVSPMGNLQKHALLEISLRVHEEAKIKHSMEEKKKIQTPAQLLYFASLVEQNKVLVKRQCIHIT